MTKKYILSVDMLGSETKTNDILTGLTNSLLRNINYKYLLFGNQKNIKSKLEKFKELNNSIEIINCEDYIEMNDKPSDIIRSKENSSMSLAINSVKKGESDAVLSFGNTGALMTFSLLNIKTLNTYKT